MSFISKLYDKKISSKGLGVFRVFFSLILLLEVFRIFRYRQLYFDPMPFLETSALSAEIPFVIWMFVLFMLIIGAFTRIMAILNYVFILIYISSIGIFEYHMDYTYTGVSFMLLFFSVSKSYSIDRLFQKLKFSNLNQIYCSKETTSVLNYWLIIFVGVGLVYLDSIFFKMGSKIWTGGLGMWYPASLPQMVIVDNQWLLNQEFLIKSLGYLTFAFEILFPFLFWVKKLRIPLLIIGVGLHLGILIEFPIPFFALGVVAVYLLMIPVCFWKILELKIQAKSASLTLFYDAECPLCMRTRIILSYFDVFKKLDFKSVQESKNTNDKLKAFSEEALLDHMHSIDKNGKVFKGIATYKKAFLLIPIFFPLGILLHLPGVSHLANKIYNYVAVNRNVERCTAENCGFLPAPQIKERDDIKLLHNFKLKDFKIKAISLFVVGVLILQVLVNFKRPFSNTIANSIHTNIKNASSKLLGVTQHGVFMDRHFEHFDKLYTVSFNNELLPFYNEFGMPQKYLRGGSWVNFNFRVNKGGRSITNNELRKGLERFISFWAYKNDVKLNNVSFQLLKKEIDLPLNWKFNSLKNNLNSTWKVIGEIVWSDNRAKFLLNTE